MTTLSTTLPATVQGKGSLIQPLFSPGLLLQADDLTKIVEYQRDMTRLLFRSMLGCGVMCGFEVVPAITECETLNIVINAGVALDCIGEAIEMTGPQEITLDPRCDDQFPSEIWVSICGGKGVPCGPRDLACPPETGDLPYACTRLRDDYKIIVDKDPPAGASSCATREYSPKERSKGEWPVDNKDDECFNKHYAGGCGCGCVCNCVVLAKVFYTKKKGITAVTGVDHSVRRFIRPVLMADPLAMRDFLARKEEKEKTAQQAPGQPAPVQVEERLNPAEPEPRPEDKVATS